MAGSYDNVMTSTFFSFVRKHWYASIKATLVYVIALLATYSFTAGASWANTVYTIVSIITFAGFAGFSYVDTWRKALRDQNLVKLGHIEYNKYRGVLSGLAADIPGFVICILIMLALRSGSSEYLDIFKVCYFIFYSPFVTLVTAISPTYPAIYFLPLLVTPIAGALGYYNGYRNIGMLGKIIYKTDRSKNKKLR